MQVRHFLYICHSENKFKIIVFAFKKNLHCPFSHAARTKSLLIKDEALYLTYQVWLDKFAAKSQILNINNLKIFDTWEPNLFRERLGKRLTWEVIHKLNQKVAVRLGLLVCNDQRIYKKTFHLDKDSHEVYPIPRISQGQKCFPFYKSETILKSKTFEYFRLVITIV